MSALCMGCDRPMAYRVGSHDLCVTCEAQADEAYFEAKRAARRVPKRAMRAAMDAEAYALGWSARWLSSSMAQGHVAVVRCDAEIVARHGRDALRSIGIDVD